MNVLEKSIQDQEYLGSYKKSVKDYVNQNIHSPNTPFQPKKMVKKGYSVQDHIRVFETV